MNPRRGIPAFMRRKSSSSYSINKDSKSVNTPNRHSTPSFTVIASHPQDISLDSGIIDATCPTPLSKSKVNSLSMSSLIFGRSKSDAILKKSSCKLFKTPLRHLFAHFELAETGLPVPIQNMLNYLYLIGPTSEGIFRKSPKAKEAKDLQLLLEAHPTASLEDTPVTVVASVFKEFLRSLPNCLLDSRLYSQWMQIASKIEESTSPSVNNDVNTSCNNEIFKMVQNLLNQLPREHELLLKHLLCLLWHIDSNQQNNKMCSSNLAVCIGPSLLNDIPYFEESSVKKGHSRSMLTLPMNFGRSTPKNSGKNSSTSANYSMCKEEISNFVPKIITFLIDNCQRLYGDQIINLLASKVSREQEETSSQLLPPQDDQVKDGRPMGLIRFSDERSDSAISSDVNETSDSLDSLNSAIDPASSGDSTGGHSGSDYFSSNNSHADHRTDHLISHRHQFIDLYSPHTVPYYSNQACSMTALNNLPAVNYYRYYQMVPTSHYNQHLHHLQPHSISSATLPRTYTSPQTVETCNLQSKKKGSSFLSKSFSRLSSLNIFSKSFFNKSGATAEDTSKLRRQSRFYLSQPSLHLTGEQESFSATGNLAAASPHIVSGHQPVPSTIAGQVAQTSTINSKVPQSPSSTSALPFTASGDFSSALASTPEHWMYATSPAPDKRKTTASGLHVSFSSPPLGKAKSMSQDALANGHYTVYPRQPPSYQEAMLRKEQGLSIAEDTCLPTAPSPSSSFMVRTASAIISAFRYSPTALAATNLDDEATHYTPPPVIGNSKRKSCLKSKNKSSTMSTIDEMETTLPLFKAVPVLTSTLNECELEDDVAFYIPEENSPSMITLMARDIEINKLVNSRATSISSILDDGGNLSSICISESDTSGNTSCGESISPSPSPTYPTRSCSSSSHTSASLSDASSGMRNDKHSDESKKQNSSHSSVTSGVRSDSSNSTSSSTDGGKCQKYPLYYDNTCVLCKKIFCKQHHQNHENQQLLVVHYHL